MHLRDTAFEASTLLGSTERPMPQQGQTQTTAGGASRVFGRASTASAMRRCSQALRSGFAPSRRKALAYALLKHPHERDRHGRRQPIPWTVKTGRFVPRCCDRLALCCDCCCEGRASDLRSFGSGITSWFKMMKLFIGTFAIVSVLSLPTLIFSSHGKGTSASQASFTTSISRLTLGNIQSQDGKVTLTEPWCSLLPTRFGGMEGGCSLSKTDMLLHMSWAESATLVVLLCSFAWLVRHKHVEAAQVGRESLGADAFTVYFPWVPPRSDRRGRQLKAHLENTVLKADGSPHPIREVVMVEDSFDLMQVYQEKGRLARVSERLQTKHALLRFMRGDSWSGGPLVQYDELAAQKGWDFRSDHAYSVGRQEGCCPCLRLRTRAIAGIEAKLAHIQRREDELTHSARNIMVMGAVNNDFQCKGAFVTFETLAGQEAAMAVFANRGCMRLCQPRHLQIEYMEDGGPSRRALVARKAPPPDVIIWPSFAMEPWSRWGRRGFTFAVSLAVVAVSLGMSLAASVVARSLLPPSEGVCADEPSAPGNETLSLGCRCLGVAWTSMNRTALMAHELSDRCPDVVCPEVLVSSPNLLNLIPSCRDWLQTRITANSLAMGAATATVVLNQVLSFVMQRLVGMEGHKSKSSENKFFSQRLFIMQLLNTVGVPLLVSAAVPLPVDMLGDSPAAFADTTPQWYEVVGSGLMLTMLLNIATPHLGVAVRAALLSQRRLATTARSQSDMNDAFTGPPHQPAKRIAQFMNTVSVCLLFSSCMPVLSMVGLTSCIVWYWVELGAFLRLHRTPPHYSVELIDLTNAMFPTILFRSLFAVWALGTPGPLGEKPDWHGDGAVWSAIPQQCSWAAEHAGMDQVTGLVTAKGLITGVLIRACNPSLAPLWCQLWRLSSSQLWFSSLDTSEGGWAACCR